MGKAICVQEPNHPQQTAPATTATTVMVQFACQSIYQLNHATSKGTVVITRHCEVQQHNKKYGETNSNVIFVTTDTQTGIQMGLSVHPPNLFIYLFMSVTPPMSLSLALPVGSLPDGCVK